MARRFNIPRPVATAPRRQPGVMNRYEAAYAEVLTADPSVFEWWFEKMRFVIGEKCSLTPDFVIQRTSGALEIHDVKGGFVRDDALVKLKVVASVFPYPVYMAIKRPKRDGGGWELKRVGNNSEKETT